MRSVRPDTLSIGARLAGGYTVLAATPHYLY